MFGAVFGREVLRAVDELRLALRQDPQVCLPHRFAREYFLAIMNRPLLRGFMIADAELLGKLAKPRGADADRHQLISLRYFVLLADHGLLREDLAVAAVAYAFQATFEGFLRAEAEIAPEWSSDAVSGLEQRANLLAWTVQRAFERDEPPRIPALRPLADAVIDVLAGLAGQAGAETPETFESS